MCMNSLWYSDHAYSHWQSRRKQVLVFLWLIIWDAMQNKETEFSDSYIRINWLFQGKSSSTPVTSDLSKTFHQICLWLHQLVKTKKSTEDSVIYLLGSPQRDGCDWLTLINQLDTIATYSIPTATCQQQQTTPNHACSCVCVCRPEVPPYRTINKIK